jgi:hypothetical protein
MTRSPPLTSPTSDDAPAARLASRIHRRSVLVLRAIMAIEFAVSLYEAQWFTAFLVFAIIVLTLAPAALGHRLRVHIPSEFQLLAVVFVFAALFLGEIHRYYELLWWWDIALHATSGLLLGIVGFLLVYLLNQSEHVDIHLRPHFVAMFAFMFAVAVGTLWEIFEFAMDRVFDATMQKPMLDDPSGLTDTMWDLIVNMIAAASISVLGWWYTRRGETSFVEVWIRRFIERNPRLFPF